MIHVTSKKVLLISHVPTHPQDAGNKRRVFENVELLRELGCEVDFLYYRCGLVDDINSMKQYFGNHHFYIVSPTESHDYTYMKSWIRNILKAAHLDKKIVLHYKIDERYDPAISKAAVRLYDKKKYDVLFVEYVMYSKVLAELDGRVMKMIDTHDKFSYREKLFLEKGESPSFFYTTPREERKGLSRADIVIAIQDKEKQFFSRLLSDTDTRVYTVGQRIKSERMPLADQHVIGFIGSNNALNQQGLRWFIDCVLPKIRKQIPDTKFKIAGEICRYVPKSNLYERLGMVEYVKDFYSDIRIIVNPVRSGTGLNIKSIEAIAHTKPMVTTTIGAKGLDSDQCIFSVADDEQKFASLVCELLLDDSQCNSLMKHCEQFIESYNRQIITIMNQLFT